MFDAQVLLAVPGTGLVLFGPWIPRGGDNLRMIVEVVSFEGGTNPELEIEVFHKDSDDIGDGTTTGTTIALTGTGRSSVTEILGLKEMVRFRYTLTTTDTNAWVIFRILPPSWFDSATT